MSKFAMESQGHVLSAGAPRQLLACIPGLSPLCSVLQKDQVPVTKKQVLVTAVWGASSSSSYEIGVEGIIVLCRRHEDFVPQFTQH